MCEYRVSAESSEEGYEKINNPEHYQSGKIEVIEVISAFKLNFSLGSAVKYILRAGKKPGEAALEDLRKALWFLEYEIQCAEEVNQNDQD